MRLRPKPAADPPPPPNFQLKIEYPLIDKVRLNPLNPNRHTQSKIVALAASMKALGVNAPLLTDGSLLLLSGEARLLACRLLGMTHVPVVRVDHLSLAEAQLFMLAENTFARQARMDRSSTARLFKDLSVLNNGLSLDLSGFSTTAIDLMIGEVDLEVSGSPSNVEELPRSDGPLVVQEGDLFLLRDPRSGLEHRVACADALIQASYGALMAGQKAHVVIIDLPYGNPIRSYLTGRGATKHREFVQGSEGLSKFELEAFVKAALVQVAAFTRKGALVYAFMDWRGIEVLLRVGDGLFAELLNIIVWSKTNPGMGAFYRSQHELVALFRTKGGAHRNNVELGVHGRNRSNVWPYAGMTSPKGRVTEEGDLLAMHPTVKPVQMIADAILDCTERRDIVLDPCLGSGSTLQAAQKTGRTFRGMDLDPRYVQTALQRWRSTTGQEPVHAENGLTLYELEMAAEAQS